MTPWYIGLLIILAAVIFVGYRMWAGNCPAPTTGASIAPSRFRGVIRTRLTPG